jgi:hypothetical protein
MTHMSYLVARSRFEGDIIVASRKCSHGVFM